MDTPVPRPERLLTFRTGGWVLVLAATVSFALIAWAVAPAVFRLVERPPGDGKNPATYGFNMTGMDIDESLIAPAMLHRDMVTPMDDPPPIITLDQLDAGRKYLVSSDRVVGVEINGEARAYPISLLNVHEVVHDTLGGRPIAVTYHWPCDTVAVFDREVNGRTVEFGVSGLLYNSNMLLYERRPSVTGDEPLWSQMLGRAVSGEPAQNGDQLTVWPSVLTGWAEWREEHPDTTVAARDPSLATKRYKKADPDQYFRAGKIRFPVRPEPPADGPPALTPCIVVDAGGERQVYAIETIEVMADADGRWRHRHGNVDLDFTWSATSETAVANAADGETEVRITPVLWFAWHAFHPDDEVVWNTNN